MRCFCGAEMEPVERGRWIGWEAVPGCGSWKRYWCMGRSHVVRASVSRRGERVYEVVVGQRITALPVGFGLVIWDEVAG